jgi:hypothetical protein
MTFGHVVECFNQRVVAEQLMHACALHTDPASMNQTHLPQASLMCGAHVLVHDRQDVARQEGVQVERLFDWDAVHVYP